MALTAMGKAFAGMGVAVGDVDGDGLLDLYVAHLGSETNTLWRQGPRGHSATAPSSPAWRPAAGAAPASAPSWPTSTSTAASTWPSSTAASSAAATAKDTGLGFWETYAERNQLFANDGSGKFRDVRPPKSLVRCGTSAGDWPAPTSTTTGRRTCWSRRSAAGPGCSATWRPTAATGSKCGPSTRNTTATPTGPRCASGPAAASSSGSSTPPELPVQQLAIGPFRIGQGDEGGFDRGDVAGRQGEQFDGGDADRTIEVREREEAAP